MQWFVQFFIHFALIGCLASEMAPAVNESHYLTKAKHAWDANYAPGDLFLESHDSHLLATTLAGVPAQFLSLDSVAWLGRALSWSLFAAAWISFSAALRIPAFFSPLVLATWYLGMRYGHWAGEWAIGGFEAKAIAYPFVLFGIAEMLRERWGRVWVLLGAAVAWHPVVGGWAGLSVGIWWLLQPNLLPRFARQWPWLLVGAGVGLIGVLPAASGLGGANQEGNVLASQIHVYFRLTHHLCPQLFSSERHWAAAGSLLILCIATWVGRWRLKEMLREQREASAGQWQLVGKILQIAWIAVGFSVLGLVIDQVCLRLGRPDIASRLLRFYFFRWSDVAVPLAYTVVGWTAVSQAVAAIGGPLQTQGRYRAKYSERIAQGAILGSLLIVVFFAFEGWQQTIPAADRLVVESTGEQRIDTDRYIDWLAACDWIEHNTPSDSLWFTPKYQQSFKWHAGRAEVVCWKDVPQDNASVHEWYRRIERCEPPRNAMGQVREWTTEELLDLAREYGFRWVLLDRTTQQTPPVLDFVYPAFSNGNYVENRSFAVMRVPESFVESD
ncbi:DUF6798 domain-containing protein [Aureliella helgolandensis]|uniref:DUF6798 domain-containing protein n=1 Tax=Aureliella helgolandensis TaxID=2527968 RepID=UPI0011A0A25F|nr:DUF6798 domain-containing protein [Aureliella helgolandensis]